MLSVTPLRFALGIPNVYQFADFAEFRTTQNMFRKTWMQLWPARDWDANSSDNWCDYVIASLCQLAVQKLVTVIFFLNLATWIWNENLLNQNPAEKTSKNKTFEPLNILEVAPVKCTVPCLGFRLWFRHFGHRRSAGGLFGIGLCLCQHRLSARDRTGQDNVR